MPVASQTGALSKAQRDETKQRPSRGQVVMAIHGWQLEIFAFLYDVERIWWLICVDICVYIYTYVYVMVMVDSDWWIVLENEHASHISLRTAGGPWQAGSRLAQPEMSRRWTSPNPTVRWGHGVLQETICSRSSLGHLLLLVWPRFCCWERRHLSYSPWKFLSLACLLWTVFAG